MSTVLVTGGAGFIGSHTAAALAAEGLEVVAVDPLRTYSYSFEPQHWHALRHRREVLLRDAKVVIASTENRDELRRAAARDGRARERRPRLREHPARNVQPRRALARGRVGAEVRLRVVEHGLRRLHTVADAGDGADGAEGRVRRHEARRRGAGGDV